MLHLSAHQITLCMRLNPRQLRLTTSALAVTRFNHSARSHKIFNFLDRTVYQPNWSPVFSRIRTLSNWSKNLLSFTNPALQSSCTFIRVLWTRIRSDPHNFDGAGSGSASRPCRSGSGGFGPVTIPIQPLLQKISSYCPKYWKLWHLRWWRER